MRRLFLLVVYLFVVLFLPSIAHAQFGVRHFSFDSLQRELNQPRTRTIQSGLEICFESMAPSDLRPANGFYARGSGADHYVVAWSDTTKAKKKKVRKPDKEKKTPTTGTQTDNDDDSFGSCLFGLLGSMCAGMFDSDDAATGGAGAGNTLTPADGAGVGLMAVPYLAVLKPMNPYANEVNIWDSPGGRNAEGEIVATLPTGTKIKATESSTFSNALWVKIETPDTPATTGWVQHRELMQKSSLSGTTSGTANGSVPNEEPFFDIGRARWQLLGDVSFSAFGETAINDEYKKNMYGLGAEVRLFLVHSLHLGFSFGYTHSNGEPQFNYVVGPITESPSDSRLNTWNLSLRLGQLYSIAGGSGYISWGIGPTAVNISESAVITIIENQIETGTRTDELSVWKVGGQVKLEGGFLLGRIPLGAYFMYSVIPWESAEEKSLTFDFLEKDRIDIFTLGISFGYSF